MSTLAVLAISAALAAAPRHVIYVHGKAVEDSGRRPSTRFGIYEYDAILDALRNAGFAVTSEQRPKDTDPSAAAERLVAEVRALIAKGVPASHITVIGASKGGVIAMLASTKLENPDLRYVLLGNCNDTILERHRPRLSGRVLSVYEKSDEFGHSCAAFFAKGAPALREHRELALDLGINHAFLYTPRKEWLEPAIEWARAGK